MMVSADLTSVTERIASARRMKGKASWISASAHDDDVDPAAEIAGEETER